MSDDQRRALLRVLMVERNLPVPEPINWGDLTVDEIRRHFGDSAGITYQRRMQLWRPDDETPPKRAPSTSVDKNTAG